MHLQAKKCPPRQPALPSPQCGTCGLQSYETRIFCCVSPPARCSVTAAPADRHSHGRPSQSSGIRPWPLRTPLSPAPSQYCILNALGMLELLRGPSHTVLFLSWGSLFCLKSAPPPRSGPPPATYPPCSSLPGLETQPRSPWPSPPESLADLDAFFKVTNHPCLSGTEEVPLLLVLKTRKPGAN